MLKTINFNKLAIKVRFMYRNLPNNTRVKGLTYRLSEKLLKQYNSNRKHKIRWKYNGPSIW